MEEIKTKKIYKGKLIKQEQICSSSHYMEIDCGIKIDVKPGQFISIYCKGLTFRRPFSVFSNNDGNIGIIFKERGKGTEYLKSLKIGDFIDISGPFGNGFNIKNKKSLLIGAGIGIAPIAFLKTKLDEKGVENMLISGFLNKSEIPLIIKTDQIYTDDGSFGQKGSVLDYLGLVINEYKPQIIYSCAPLIVLKNIARIGQKYGIETQIAMEKVMACSIGVCRGCVIDVIKNEKIIKASVCKDGPVFYGDEIVWQ